MKTTKVEVSEKDIRKYKKDLLVFLVAQKDSDIICDSLVRELIEKRHRVGDFLGKKGETVVLYPADSHKCKLSAERILVVGLGEIHGAKSSSERLEVFRSVGGTVSSACEKLKVREIGVGPGPEPGFYKQELASALTEGVLLADYRFNKYKKANEDEPSYEGLKTVTFFAGKDQKASVLRKGTNQASIVAEAVKSARNMANEPGNLWTPSSFAQYAEEIADSYDLKCRILDKSDMERLGMGGILAVNKGSAEPPKLVLLEYNPSGRTSGTVMLVGKGLTFDSGGISLKPAAGMEDMKYDMCGGAAVLCAMEAIARLKPKARVVALVPSTDNMSGSSATKPGDIITHFSGVTSEIINTDAEGRLILADAIAYGIEKYKPDCLVDLATLTGAVIIGLGHHYTGLVANDDDLAARLEEAGGHTGEPIWRLPINSDYSKQIESRVADIKNSGGRPAGTITAAAYLEKFVGETPWAHLDIAGTAWDFTEKTYIPKGPSGIMVRTLVQFVKNWKK